MTELETAQQRIAELEAQELDLVTLYGLVQAENKKLKAEIAARKAGAGAVAWYEYNPDLDAWFLAYSRNPIAKTRPLVFGDTHPQSAAQQGNKHE